MSTTLYSPEMPLILLMQGSIPLVMTTPSPSRRSTPAMGRAYETTSQGPENPGGKNDNRAPSP